MKTNKSNFTLTFIALAALMMAGSHSAVAQSSAFTYQGRLNDGANPATGGYDLRFSLFDTNSGGSQIGSPLTNSSVGVTNGLFTVALDFGAGMFSGAGRWLEIGVRTNGGGSFTTLNPRQQLTATPYALTAGNLNGVLSSASLSGTYANAVTLNNAANSFSGNGSNLTALNASQLAGGTMPDARLSANVALRSGGNAFTGNQTIAGSVGIGTASPTATLEVAGSIKASGGVGFLWAGSSLNADQGGSIELGDSLLTNTTPFLDFHYGVTTNQDYNARLINDGDGQLTVVGGFRATGSVVVDQSGQNNGAVSSNSLTFGTSSGEGIASRRTGGGNQFGLDFYTTSLNRMTILNTGNVGIGTTTPATALDVNGAVTAASDVTEAFEVRGAAAGYALQDRFTGAAGRWSLYANNGTLGFYSASAGTTLMSVSPSGNVTATAFSGSGAGLTNLNLTSLTPPPGMVLIPAGAFTMGDSLDGSADAVPIAVTVSAFYMDANLVSWSQWQSVYFWATAHGYGFVDPGSGKAANHPVQTVDWYDCVKWCNARSEQAGKTPVYYTDAGFTTVYRTGEVAVYANWAAKGYRLPTEAEWEKAARGGLSGQRFPWGNVINQNLANYYGKTASYPYDLGPNGYNTGFTNGGFPYTSPVGSFAANGYGLYDMDGNVFETCWDWYGAPYAGGTDPHGPVSGPVRVIRGGSWDNFAIRCRTANRYGINPTGTNGDLGFRAVLPPGQ